MITGSKSIENDWESYVSELEILGLANMLDILNPLYAEAIK